MYLEDRSKALVEFPVKGKNTVMTDDVRQIAQDGNAGEAWDVAVLPSVVRGPAPYQRLRPQQQSLTQGFFPFFFYFLLYCFCCLCQLQNPLGPGGHTHWYHGNQAHTSIWPPPQRVPRGFASDSCCVANLPLKPLQCIPPTETCCVGFRQGRRCVQLP